MLHLEKERLPDKPIKEADDSNKEARATIPKNMQEFLAQAAPYKWKIVDDNFPGPFQEIQFHAPERLSHHSGMDYIDLVADLKHYGGIGHFCYYPRHRLYGVYNGSDNYKFVFVGFDQAHFEQHFPWYLAAQWHTIDIRKEWGITLVPYFFLDRYAAKIVIGDYKKKAVFSEELSGRGIDLAINQGEFKRWKKKAWAEKIHWENSVYTSPTNNFRLFGQLGTMDMEVELIAAGQQQYKGLKVFVPNNPYWSSSIVFGTDLLNRHPNWDYDYTRGKLVLNGPT